MSVAKESSRRPGLDALMKAVARREVDMVAAWSVDREGKSLTDLMVDLFLHKRGPESVDALRTRHVPDAWRLRGVRRAMIRERAMSGAKAQGV